MFGTCLVMVCRLIRMSDQVVAQVKRLPAIRKSVGSIPRFVLQLGLRFFRSFLSSILSLSFTFVNKPTVVSAPYIRCQLYVQAFPHCGDKSAGVSRYVCRVYFNYSGNTKVPVTFFSFFFSLVSFKIYLAYFKLVFDELNFVLTLIL